MTKIISIQKVRGIAGAVEYRAVVQYPGEEPATLTFAGSVYGSPGPVVMVTPGGQQTFVHEPVRFGSLFTEQWVRSFFDVTQDDEPAILPDAQTRKARLDKYIDDAIKANPVEAKILRRIVRAFKKAGNPITSVYDGAEMNKVKTEREIFVQVFNLDECYLYAKDGGWVFLVSGNEWDMLSNYTLSVEEIVEPINDWTGSKS